MALADPQKEASTFERMNAQPQFLSSNKITRFFKKWTAESGVLKKIYCPYKNLMLETDPINNSYSQNSRTPKEN